MLSGRRVRLTIVAVVIIGGLAAAAAWYFLIRDEGAFHFVIEDEAPPKVSLAAALELLAARPNGSAQPAGELAGTWVIAQGGESFAGYRVRETLATFGANTAVGRTHDIEGVLEYDGRSITRVEVTADLTMLRSDQAVRDEQLQVQAIETDTYPTARFRLTSLIQIEGAPEAGEAVDQTVRGELTLHGVTREVEVEVEGALSGGVLVVVGAVEIALADFEIERPVSFSVLSIEERGVLEFQLVFERE